MLEQLDMRRDVQEITHLSRRGLVGTSSSRTSRREFTNLFGRGMDIERVNKVFNYDMPEDTDTYLHRMARAGRFGTKGLAITFVSDKTESRRGLKLTSPNYPMRST